MNETNAAPAAPAVEPVAPTSPPPAPQVLDGLVPEAVSAVAEPPQPIAEAPAPADQGVIQTSPPPPAEAVPVPAFEAALDQLPETTSDANPDAEATPVPVDVAALIAAVDPAYEEALRALEQATYLIEVAASAHTAARNAIRVSMRSGSREYTFANDMPDNMGFRVRKDRSLLGGLIRRHNEALASW